MKAEVGSQVVITAKDWVRVMGLTLGLRFVGLNLTWNHFHDPAEIIMWGGHLGGLIESQKLLFCSHRPPSPQHAIRIVFYLVELKKIKIGY